MRRTQNAKPHSTCIKNPNKNYLPSYGKENGRDLPEDQFGFRRGRGTREGIGSLRLIIDKFLKLDKSLVVVFIFVGKAFDHVDWNVLFKPLRDLKIDYRDRRITKNQVYKNRMALIGQQKLEAKISKGERQGYGLLPMLFNIYIEEALKGYWVRNTCGVYINGRIYSTLRSADDIALVVEIERDMEIALELLDNLLNENANGEKRE